jgi:hypothetical protein
MPDLHRDGVAVTDGQTDLRIGLRVVLRHAYLTAQRPQRNNPLIGDRVPRRPPQPADR